MIFDDDCDDDYDDYDDYDDDYDDNDNNNHDNDDQNLNGKLNSALVELMAEGVDKMWIGLTDVEQEDSWK